MALRLGLASALVCALLAAPSAAPRAADQHPHAHVPYVPTPQVVVDEMLRIADVGPRDFVIDLGSGDGRIVITAAKKFGARGLGVEIDSALVAAARSEARRQGVADRVRFLEQNLFVTDIERATVLAMYLYPTVLAELRPRLLAELKPGTRVVSHDFDLGEWRPDARRTVPVPDKPYGPPSSEIYLWIVPANAAGIWRWRLAVEGRELDHELALEQTFQALAGKLVVGGRPARLEEARMRGEEIRFAIVAEEQGRTLRIEYEGRVTGDAIFGRARLGGGEQEWKAVRLKRGEIEKR
ncbi:MAG TPA: class I SAM-dependent methyltransferase [Burkholderiales bacterium]|nr:class I SAM-dependent methyltransferase [Burkholderiales bacterium]